MTPKFRAWHKELGRMMLIEIMYFFFFDNELEELELNDPVMNDHISVYPDEIELMQSTGFVDEDDKEIFEGDILKVKIMNGQSWLETVRYNDEKAMFVSKEVNRKVPESPLYDLFNTDLFVVEIIGNIYENPELLEVKE
nr:MAG TPA: YopX protein [Caudoviricetes sp.]